MENKKITIEKIVEELKKSLKDLENYPIKRIELPLYEKNNRKFLLKELKEIRTLSFLLRKARYLLKCLKENGYTYGLGIARRCLSLTDGELTIEYWSFENEICLRYGNKNHQEMLQQIASLDDLIRFIRRLEKNRLKHLRELEREVDTRECSKIKKYIN